MKKIILFLTLIVIISYANAQEQKRNYHFNGLLESSGQIDKNHFPTGEWQYYSENGDLHYVLNHTTNYSKEYYTTGELKAEGRFNPLTGAHIQEWITYYKNGKIKTKGLFDKNGTLISSELLKEGEKQK